MRNILTGIVAILLPFTACQADDWTPSTSFNVGATTDYRYRGISQSALKPALQGGADLATGAGIYAGAWASTIRWIDDAGGSASAEVDLYGGYKTVLPGGVALDLGALHYRYPSHGLAVSPDTTELYASLGLGTVTVKYSRAVTNLFGFADSKGSGYVDITASLDLGGGWTFNPHLGYQKVASNDLYSYADYAVGVAKQRGDWSLAAAIVGAETERIQGTSVYVSPSGRQLGRPSLVGTAKLGF
jgi:uncharacterized protein (TIGR02001 family)